MKRKLYSFLMSSLFQRELAEIFTVRINVGKPGLIPGCLRKVRFRLQRWDPYGSRHLR